MDYREKTVDQQMLIELLQQEIKRLNGAMKTLKETNDLLGCSVPVTPGCIPVEWPKHVTIAHDGFSGTLIGHYQRLDGPRGGVFQLDNARVVHVYGERWFY